MIKICYPIIDFLHINNIIHWERKIPINRVLTPSSLGTLSLPRFRLSTQASYGLIVRPSIIACWKFSQSASLIHWSWKLLDSQDSKKEEDEKHEYHSIVECSHWVEKCYDLFLHLWNRFDASQWPEDSQNSQRSETCYIHERHKFYEANNDNECV